MHDARIRRHDAEIAEGRLAPAKQHVALAVALEFEQRIHIECVAAAESVDLDRVVDHEVGRHQRIGAAGVGAQGHQGIAHSGEIHHARDAGEVLQQHARGHEADLFPVGTGDTAGDIVDVGGRDTPAVFRAKQVFEKDSGGERKPPYVTDPFLLECGETKVVEFGIPCAQLRRRAKTVGGHQFNYNCAIRAALKFSATPPMYFLWPTPCR